MIARSPILESFQRRVARAHADVIVASRLEKTTERNFPGVVGVTAAAVDLENVRFVLKLRPTLSAELRASVRVRTHGRSGEGVAESEEDGRSRC